MADTPDTLAAVQEAGTGGPNYDLDNDAILARPGVTLACIGASRPGAFFA